MAGPHAAPGDIHGPVIAKSIFASVQTLSPGADVLHVVVLLPREPGRIVSRASETAREVQIGPGRPCGGAAG